jgi:hypothetical protein
MRMYAVALIALAGLCSPANAQTQCPELTRLRAEAAQASARPRGAPALGYCETYIRISIAWNDVAKYASEHREACDVSSPVLEAIEKAHREAVKVRDNICSGRPALPYRADIIQR